MDRNLNKPKGKRSLLLLFLAGDTHITFIAVIITHFFVQQHEKMTSHVIVMLQFLKKKKSINAKNNISRVLLLKNRYHIYPKFQI